MNNGGFELRFTLIFRTQTTLNTLCKVKEQTNSNFVNKNVSGNAQISICAILTFSDGGFGVGECSVVCYVEDLLQDS